MNSAGSINFFVAWKERKKSAEGTIVDLSVAEGKLVVAPIRKKKATLKQLLAKVHRSNLHGEIDSGPAVGQESW